VEEGSPALAETLRLATPHRTRHTHATHLLEGGAELTSVRDKLRHASLATTSMYRHIDDARRAKQLADQFAAPRSKPPVSRPSRRPPPMQQIACDACRHLLSLAFRAMDL